MKNFEDYAYYYNAFYGDKDYAGEAKMVDKLIRKYGCTFIPSQEICLLNIGCGTGKHDFELSKRGYRVKGIDISDNMISIAQKTYGKGGGELSFEVGDFHTYRGDVKHDAVISLFHVVSYQTSNEDVLDAFHTANQNLKDRGLFLFDLWYGPGVMNELPENRIKQVEDERNILIRYASPIFHWNENIIDVNYDVIVISKITHEASHIKETHRMRFFFKPEIENMLRQSGFKLLSCLDCNTLKETNSKSWTAYFVARKC